MNNKYTKLISVEEAVQMIRPGDRVMVGGFAGNGNPMGLIHALKNKGTGDLTLIGNDTGDDYLYDMNSHVGVLVRNGQIKKVIATHIGRNQTTCQLFNEGTLEVEFVPQGTLVERIRCAGFGLGAAITKTGIGTEVEKGKQKIIIDDEEYLVELPLHADVALVKVAKADKLGNIVVKGTNVSHSLMMLTAATVSIVEADEIVEVGEINPNEISMPGIFVNYIVQGGQQ